MTRKGKRDQRRLGLMTLEVVMTTAVTLPIACALLLLGIQMCRIVYSMLGILVSWPFV